MIISLLALAVVDSINPSAIAVTLYLLGQGRSTAQVVTYLLAIFGTYLTMGVAMMLGLGAVLPGVQSFAEGRLGLVVQSLIGLAMLVYAVRAPAASPSTRRPEPHAATIAAIALLGVTVTALELPTAVPYFGAVALLTSASLPMAQWLPLLAGYNAIFVLPPALLLTGHLLAGRALEARYAALRARLQTGAQTTVLWIAGLVGSGLLVSGVIEYVVRYLLRPH